ncbi:MAG: class II aldolase/adducin family protein [Actinomycetota bacterium]|nr:class II aldolase/adducin family protein [Actinomycetota bacterium]
MTATLRRVLLDACRDLEDRGLNRGTSGNCSVRVDGGLLVTPSGITTGDLSADAMVLMCDDGTWAGDVAPSSEWRIHRDAYRHRPDLDAVVHTHSTHAVAMACLRRDIPPFHYMVAAAGGAVIRCADYALFGTEELSRNALAALGDRRACLLANHGMLALGATMPAAIALAVEVEALCEQYLAACTAGEPVLLEDAQMAQALERFATYGRPSGPEEPHGR